VQSVILFSYFSMLLSYFPKDQFIQMAGRASVSALHFDLPGGMLFENLLHYLLLEVLALQWQPWLLNVELGL
jgi:hypothetical protein